jgi:hypothetical protein
MRKVLLLLLLSVVTITSYSQTYLSESFENEFTPNTASGPNAPTGWTQTRLGTLAGVPGAPGASGQRDWARSVWSGTGWASNTAPNIAQIPYNTATNGPTGAQQGTGALWFNDGWAAGSGTSGQNLRRLETPTVDLSASTNPYIIFFHSQFTSSASLTVVGSLDGGTTWNTLATYGSTTNWSWIQRIVPIPATYKIATAKFGLQVSNTWGSYDVFIDNFTIQEPVSSNITSTNNGGLWSSTATWVGGVIPTAFDNVTIANGATVTIDGAYTINSLTIGQGTSGTLNWNGTSNALSVNGNITVSAGARLLAYTPAGTGQIINVGGNFTNNGYVNLAAGTTAGAGALLNFNGSQATGNLTQTLGGTGTFEGNGTQGIIRALFFQTTGTTTISTTQNLITTSFAHTAGTLNTNGKLTIDNTALVYGRPINTQVASVAVTTMGVAYTNPPVVFGGAVTLWTASGTATSGTRYFSGNNVYLATSAGTFDASTAPTHTTGSVTNGSVSLLWIGTLGTIGTAFQATSSVSVGTQVFYGNNLYTCTVAGIPSAAAPPVHTSGTAVSGAATFLYVGTPATVTVNYDATAQNVRSLTLTNVGTGYSAAPAITFSTNGGTFTTAASATATVFQSIAYFTNSQTQSSGNSVINGAININSNQSASSFSGVGSLFTTSGGVGYTVAPLVGFSGPTAINLVTNGGSGYTTAPTITVTGGTLISGSALTSSNFTITVAGGRVVSVYLNASTTALYSVPPTLAFSAGNATLAFPTGCWPAATASIGANGQITSFTVTNAGFGYTTTPTVGFGATSGTPEGGTFISAATAPTARIGLYNIVYGYFAPAASNAQNTLSAIVPTNGKVNAITVNSASGAALAGNLELFASAPLTLTAGTLDMGSNTLTFSNFAYAGASGSTTASVSGRIVLTTPGGSVTRTFPYDAAVAVATGTGTLAAGSTVTTLTASRTAAPSGTVNGGIASLTGSRSYRIQSNTGSVYGTAPTVTLNYNATDALTTVNNADLLIVQSAAVTGAWTVRSLSSGTGTLSATGSRTTATSGVGPIVPTGDDYFAWSSSLPCSGTPTTGVITGSTDACTGGTISFTSAVFSSGNGMTYRWQTSPDNNAWTNTNVTTPGSYSATFSGTIWVRRVDTCTNSGQFAISNAIQVTARASTLCYCGPNTGVSIHSSTSNSIDNVTISGTTLNNSNVGVGNSTTGYIEFPATGNTTATLLQGTNYNLLTTLASSGTVASVWIDFNRNGTYESTEWFQITTSAPSSGVIITTPISVPVNATLGLTGMRVRSRSTTPNGAVDACTSFGSGETEEYYITIAAPPSCSGTPTAGTVSGPSSSVCAGSAITLTATGFTNGLAGLVYRWQSGTSATGPWTNTTGTNPSSFTTSVSTNTWFRLVDTCTNGNAFAVSNVVQVSVSSPASIPYNQGFESITANDNLPGCMSASNLGTLNRTYIAATGSYNQAARSGTKFGSFRYQPGAAGAWFFTDPIQLTGGQAYDAHVWYVTDGATGFDSLNIAFGTSASASAMSTPRVATVLNPTNTTYANLKGTFTPPTTGVYVIGYQVTGTSLTPWYVTIDDIAVVPTGVFPVTLSNFKGERQGTNNYLSWTTLNETNNAGFEVLRSADGINFTSMGFVASKAVNGTSTNTISYDLTDFKPFTTASYYRLKQVDKDGKTTLSSIVMVKGIKPNQLMLTSIYPNPTAVNLNVALAAPKADNVTFIVSDLAGKVVLKKVFSVVAGDNNLTIPVANLSSGSYTIKALCADGCETAVSKFVKQ